MSKNFPYLNSWTQEVEKLSLLAQLFKNVLLRDFLGGTVGRNHPANAENICYDPLSGKIPHATEQLIPCAATTEAPGPRACALHKRSRGNERPVLCNWRVAL